MFRVLFLAFICVFFYWNKRSDVCDSSGVHRACPVTMVSIQQNVGGKICKTSELILKMLSRVCLLFRESPLAL